MILLELFNNISDYSGTPVNFSESLLESLFILEYEESGLVLKQIIEESYTDGIDGFENVENDGNKITGIFFDKVSSGLIKRYQFEVTEDEVSYKLLNPEDLDGADFDELEFAAATGTKAQPKKKNCVKGTSCGASCISKDRACKQSMSSESKEKVKNLLTKQPSKKEVASVQKEINKTTKKSKTGEPLDKKDKTKDTGKSKTNKKQEVTEMKTTTSQDRLETETNNLLQYLDSKRVYTELFELRKQTKLGKEDFDNLLMDLQAKKLVYLQNGSKQDKDLTEGDKANAIKSEVRGYLNGIELTDEGEDYVKNLKKENKPKDKAIKDYPSFKKELETTFTKLEKEHRGIVPIHKLRDTLNIPDKDFDEWLMKSQADGDFYLQSGEARGATQEQKNKGIQSSVRGLLFFVSRADKD